MAESQVNNNHESQARQLGWVPKEQFRGDPEKWVDAETFVRRGEEIMPILKHNNARLQAEVEALRGQLTEAQETIKASTEAIEALREYQTEATQLAVEKAKKELRAQIAAAREAGNVEEELELTEQLQEVRNAERDVKAKDKGTGKPAAPAPAPAPTQPAPHPEWVAWQKENPWFGTDRRRTALMIAEAEELRADPANKGLVGRAFFDRAAENVDAILNPRATHSKVEDGQGSATPPAGKPGKKGYNDLPQEAKDMCERQAEKLVGKGRAFKDKAEWQAHYAREYFATE